MTKNQQKATKCVLYLSTNMNDRLSALAETEGLKKTTVAKVAIAEYLKAKE